MLKYVKALVLLTLFQIALYVTAQETQTSMPTTHPSSVRTTKASNMASTYVALDSWVYPAFDRLSALGAVQTAFASLRPWTRLDCARLVSEAGEIQVRDGFDDEATEIYAALRTEFLPELANIDDGRNLDAQIESVYIRTDGIMGKSLNDGFHFAQTEVNNFGRPYGEGLNSYDGSSLSAVDGRVAAYVRFEFQRAGTAISVPPAAQAAIATADFTQTAQLGPAADLARGRLLDAYASFGFDNYQFSIGKQSMWWGPGKGGPLLWSDNAEPITMARLDRIRPLEIPIVSRFLGPIRGQFFFGRLEGQQFVHSDNQTTGEPGVAYPDQPFIHGQKLSFKPSENFEFSVSRTVIFGGPEFPVTFSSFWRSFASTSTENGKTDPGDRRAAFDASYRIPGLRDRLTVYVDTFTDDEFFPLAYPRHSAWSPGFYLPQLPHLPKLDFRAEGFLSPQNLLFPGFYYFNVRYLSGYTNNRQLIGSWIGREGDGLQLWSSWWFSPRSSVQASYRSQNASSQFLRGGDLHDMTLASDTPLGRDWSIHLSGQYERWRFPLLFTNPSSNFTVSAQLTWSPASERH
jgi:hypothetical protein